MVILLDVILAENCRAFFREFINPSQRNAGHKMFLKINFKKSISKPYRTLITNLSGIKNRVIRYVTLWKVFYF